jgi:hypothetical protein
LIASAAAATLVAVREATAARTPARSGEPVRPPIGEAGA